SSRYALGRSLRRGEQRCSGPMPRHTSGARRGADLPLWTCVPNGSCGGGRRQNGSYLRARPGDSLRRGVRADLQSFDMDEREVRQSDETEDRPQIWLLKIERRHRACAVDTAAAGDDDDLLVLEESLGPSFFGVPECSAGAHDVIDPRAQIGRDGKV